MDNKKKILLMLIVVIISVFIIYSLNGDNERYITYKEFYNELENGNIDSVTIEDNGVKFSKKNDNNQYYTDNPEYDNFKEKLLLQGVNVATNSNVETTTFVFDMLFYLMFFGVIIFGIYKVIDTNNNTFKVVKHTKIKFENIAGMKKLKNDMMQVVEMLKNPKKFSEKGIRQTKGIIFEGEPGNGKTLFAKALAEEANVNFIATKGADFQSAMMSVGALKIKTLFKKARKHKPCIIFIDEFDGIGERRNYAGTGVDKENNRIIIAMLNEMDGFNSEDGILVIAATNSYNSLDPALIRPGRFDLKYSISNPDLETRKELIDMYTKKKILSEDISKETLAEAFENLSCSAIETILNEAAMEAITRKSDKISLNDIIVASRKTNCNVNFKKFGINKV